MKSKIKLNYYKKNILLIYLNINNYFFNKKNLYSEKNCNNLHIFHIKPALLKTNFTSFKKNNRSY